MYAVSNNYYSQSFLSIIAITCSLSGFYCKLINTISSILYAESAHILLSQALSVPESFYPLSFGFPAGCQRSTCDYFLVMGPNRINNSYIDIYLEGNAQGWLAVGFSEDRGMVSNSA